tara:strand:+ start:527 stop:943 length:417 start_codon:yes stop_codon:yes gene_type:complete
MKLIERSVLSYEDDRSDKVYILEIFRHSTVENTPVAKTGTNCSLIATWGRRTSPRLSSQVKLENILYERCFHEYLKIVRTKKSAGYITVKESELHHLDIPGYTRKDMASAKSTIVSANSASYEVPKTINKASDIRLIL